LHTPPFFGNNPNARRGRPRLATVPLRPGGVSESEARIAARNTIADLGGHLGWPKGPVQIAGRLSRFHRQEVWWVPVRCLVAPAA
jgi:hypothetical protein